MLVLACLWAGAAGCGEARETGPSDGRVMLRLWDYRWPTAPDGTSYAGWLERRVRLFEAAHPGVTVQVHLLDLETGWEQVRRSLADGRVPDVLGTRPGDPVFLSGRWQVPAERFLDGGARRRYLPPALDLAAAGGRIWVWPRWFAADAWLVRAEPLRAAGLAPETLVVRGWDLTGSLSRLRRLKGDPPAVVPGEGALFFRPLLAWEEVEEVGGWGRRLKGLLGLRVEGARRWRVEPTRLRAAVDWVRLLRAAGVLPPPGRLGDRGQDGLAAFLSGRASLLAGAEPWLLAMLLHREAAAGRTNDLVLLPVPVPVLDEQRGAPVHLRTLGLRLGGLALFRPPDVADGRRLRLAAELAAFLSRQGHPWARGPGPLFPADREAWLRWARGSGGSAVFSAFTLHRARGAVRGADLAEAAAEAEAWRSLRPALNAFWEGRGGPTP